MGNATGGKRGLSQVVTTLILLVVSVLLAGVVTFYATNITMTRTEQEDIQLLYVHCWVNSTDSAVAALYIENVGGRDVLIDKIVVRGVESTWSDVYYNSTRTNNDLVYMNHEEIQNSTFSGLSQASDDLPVESSGSRIIYVLDPDNIDLVDIGTTVSVTVFSRNSQYIKEVNVNYAGE